MKARAEIASISSGSRTSRKRYIRRRHVQKLSSPGPRRSVMPAMARWKVWLCRFGIAGRRAVPARRSSPDLALASGVTVAMRGPARVMRTLRAQPSGRRASGAKRAVIGQFRPCTIHVQPMHIPGTGLRASRWSAWRSPACGSGGVKRKMATEAKGAFRVGDSVVITNATVATMETGGAPYGLCAGAAVAVRDGRIAAVGPEAAVLAAAPDLPVTDVGGRLVTPALVDCHTHVVFGGNRAREFAMRLEGESYEAIARAGGGIVSTVRATREADAAALLAAALPRVDALIAEGVATIEVKSGYGLDRETELRMLRVAREIGRVRPVRVRTTFLGAHAVPEGIGADAYIDDVCIPALRAARGRGAGRRGRRLLRGDRLLARAGGAGVRGGAGPRAAGEDPCRAAVEPRGGGARRAVRRAVGGPSRVARRRGRRGDGRGGDGGGDAAGGVLHAPGDASCRRWRRSGRRGCRWRWRRTATRGRRR